MNIDKWKKEWKIKCYKNGYKSLFNTQSMEDLLRRYNGDVKKYKRIRRYLFNNENKEEIEELLFYGYENERVFEFQWKQANTRDKRRKMLNELCTLESYGRYYDEFDALKKYPNEYCVALYEDEEDEIMNDIAIKIQKHIKGYLTRKTIGVYNPNCEMGKKFLRKMFKYI